jgi:hypothetical protein
MNRPQINHFLFLKLISVKIDSIVRIQGCSFYHTLSPTSYKPVIHLHVNFCLLSIDGNCQLQTDY